MTRTNARLNEADIKKLEAVGFKRWTKGSYDRLYISPTKLGLHLAYYNTGNISSAWLDENDGISNCRARKILAMKIWIEIDTGEVRFKYPMNGDSGYEMEFRDRAEALMEETLAPEPEPEPETVFHYYDEACEFLADALGLQEEPYDRSWWIADPSALIGRGDDPVDVKVDMGRLVNMTCDARLDDESELEELVFPYDMDDPADADLVLDLMWKCSEIVEEETIPEISEADIIDYDDSEIRFIIETTFDGTPDDYDLDGIRDAIAYADEDGELFYVPGCWDESGRATEKLHEAIRRHRRS